MIDRSTLSPGYLIPTLSREGTFHHWNRYAGVNHEFADHHMDDAVGRHEGFDAAVGMAPLIHAYMYTMLRNWIGEDTGWVAAVTMQFRRPFLRGRTLTGHGQVQDVRQAHGETSIELEIWADDDMGTRLADGTARVMLAS